jgi:hypothetical protein
MIQVRKVSENCFSAFARKAQYEGAEEWSTTEPLNEKTLVDELMRRGFPVQDIVDAMMGADPTWIKRQSTGGTN